MATKEELRALREKFHLGEFAPVARYKRQKGTDLGKAVLKAPAGAGGPGKHKKPKRRKKNLTTWSMPQQFGGRSWPHDRGSA